MADRDYYVTVCEACGTASCWHGEHMCPEARNADIKTSTASTLRSLNSEHPSNYSRKKLRDVYGHDVDEVPRG